MSERLQPIGKVRPGNPKIILGPVRVFAMRIMSLMNDLKRTLFGVVLSIAVCHMACAEAPSVWQATTGKRAFIEVNGKRIRVDQSLQTKLRHAEAAAFMPLALDAAPGESLRWLLLRESSRVWGDAGFCGAGHEDHLLLVKVVKSVGNAVDDFLAQSCLQSVSMDMDQFEELLSAISIDTERKQLILNQSIASETDSVRREVNITIAGRRMRVSTRNVVE